jgi:hypothetical protein
MQYLYHSDNNLPTPLPDSQQRKLAEKCMPNISLSGNEEDAISSDSYARHWNQQINEHVKNEALIEAKADERACKGQNVNKQRPYREIKHLKVPRWALAVSGIVVEKNA